MNIQAYSPEALQSLLGNIDIYLLDQVLKGDYLTNDLILDAGCGEGRNIHYLIKNGYQVYGIDKNPDAIARLKYSVQSIDSQYPLDRFTTGKAEDLPYATNSFNKIISSAVLHFAENKNHFFGMLGGLARVLKPGGTLFVRMACDLGIENQIQSMGNGVFFLPDGSIRYLLTKTLLEECMEKFSLELIEPFRSVLVDGKRSMSTFILRLNH